MRALRTKKITDSWLGQSLVLNLKISDREFRLYCYFLTVNPEYEFTNVTLGKQCGLSRRQVEYGKKRLIDLGLVFTDRISQHDYILYVGNECSTALEVRKEYTNDVLRQFAKIDSDEYPDITSEIK